MSVQGSVDQRNHRLSAAGDQLQIEAAEPDSARHRGITDEREHFDHRRFLQRAVAAYSDRDQPRGNQQYHQSGSQRSHAAVAGIQNSD